MQAMQCIILLDGQPCITSELIPNKQHAVMYNRKEISASDSLSTERYLS